MFCDIATNFDLVRLITSLFMLWTILGPFSLIGVMSKDDYQTADSFSEAPVVRVWRIVLAGPGVFSLILAADVSKRIVQRRARKTEIESENE